MVVVDGLVDGVAPEDTKAPIAVTSAYIAECCAAYPRKHGPTFERLAKRRVRLQALLDAQPRSPHHPCETINLRQRHRALPADPLTTSAVTTKTVRKRRGRPPKNPKCTRTRAAR